jgi:predicted phage-related endonuclease
MTLPLKDRTIPYATREEWLASRSAFLGASELAAVLGVSSYKDATPFNVWRRKVEPTAEDLRDDTKDKPWLEWGHRLEPVILEKFQAEHPHLVTTNPDGIWTYCHPVYTALRGTPDGLVYQIDDDGEQTLVAGVDAKNIGVQRKKHFGEEGTDDIPDDYLLQGLAYCEIFEVDIWYFAVLFGGSDYREFKVERNQEVAEAAIVKALDWFVHHVDGHRQPDVDGSEEATKFLARIWPEEKLDLLPPTPQTLALQTLIADATEEMNRNKEQIDTAKNALRQIIGESSGIESVCTWKKNKDSTKVDWKAVAAELALHVNTVQVDRITKANTATKQGPRVLRMK